MTVRNLVAHVLAVLFALLAGAWLVYALYHAKGVIPITTAAEIAALGLAAGYLWDKATTTALLRWLGGQLASLVGAFSGKQPPAPPAAAGGGA